MAIKLEKKVGFFTAEQIRELADKIVASAPKQAKAEAIYKEHQVSINTIKGVVFNAYQTQSVWWEIEADKGLLTAV